MCLPTGPSRSPEGIPRFAPRRQGESLRRRYPGGGCRLPRRRTLREKWTDYGYFRASQRFHFDERHPNLRWLPNAIAILFLGVTATALVLNSATPNARLSGYLMALVTVDFGMAAVAVLSWIIGRRLWREDHDPRYLAAAIGFASLPVWGVLETMCVSWIIPKLSASIACGYSGALSVVAVAWLIVIPGTSVLWDFRGYIRQQGLPAARATPAGPR